MVYYCIALYIYVFSVLDYIDFMLTVSMPCVIQLSGYLSR